MKIMQRIRSFQVAFCHVCFRRRFFIPGASGTKNRRRFSGADFQRRSPDCVPSPLEVQQIKLVHNLSRNRYEHVLYDTQTCLTACIMSVVFHMRGVSNVL